MNSNPVVGRLALSTLAVLSLVSLSACYTPPQTHTQTPDTAVYVHH
ncbi:MAG: hypothetical protein RLZZ555_2235, partial [Pseudomonadota bacterium]